MKGIFDNFHDGVRRAVCGVQAEGLRGKIPGGGWQIKEQI